MTCRLARRKPARTKEIGQRVYMQHRAWVRKFQCCVPGCQTNERIEFAHVRNSELIPAREKGGTSLKPHDRWGIPLCQTHHAEQHQIGEERFQKKYRFDMGTTAANLARNSPHRHRWESEDE